MKSTGPKTASHIWLCYAHEDVISCSSCPHNSPSAVDTRQQGLLWNFHVFLYDKEFPISHVSAHNSRHSNLGASWNIHVPLFANNMFTQGQFWPSDFVIASICRSNNGCVSVCQSWTCLPDNLSPLQARVTKFGLECKKNLFGGLIDFDLEGHI